jgi:hypothetical protein
MKIKIIVNLELAIYFVHSVQSGPISCNLVIGSYLQRQIHIFKALIDVIKENHFNVK